MIQEMIKAAVEQKLKALVDAEVEKVLAVEEKPAMVFDTPKQWLDRKLHDKRVSQRALSAYLGVDAGSMSRVASGARRLSINEILPLARFFDVPVEEVVLVFSK
jgi:predicted membrane chloride channel (bestrophin family)